MRTGQEIDIDAIDWAGLVRPGDLVLVKGSRSVKMERVIEELLGRFAPVDAPSNAGVGH